MTGVESAHARARFDLDDEDVVNEQVNPKPAGEPDPFKLERHTALPLHSKTIRGQRSSEHDLVNAFKQSRAKPLMQLDGRIHRSTGDFLGGIHGASSLGWDPDE